LSDEKFQRAVVASMNGTSALNILADTIPYYINGFHTVATRQIKLMRKLMEMPIFIQLLQKFRSLEFQRVERYIMHDQRWNA
jgi:hypothetical protein